MYYTLHTARSKDRVGLMRILGTLAACESDRAFEDPFLHFLASSNNLYLHMLSFNDKSSIFISVFFLLIGVSSCSYGRGIYC